MYAQYRSFNLYDNHRLCPGRPKIIRSFFRAEICGFFAFLVATQANSYPDGNKTACVRYITFLSILLKVGSLDGCYGVPYFVRFLSSHVIFLIPHFYLGLRV